MSFYSQPTGTSPTKSYYGNTPNNANNTAFYNSQPNSTHPNNVPNNVTNNVTNNTNYAQQQQQQQQQPQHYQQQHNQHNQQIPANPSQWATSAATAFLSSSGTSNDAMLDMGANLASGFANSTAARFMPGAQGFWGNLKYYFDVTNTYVLKKMGRLLFPWTITSWRRVQGTGNPTSNPTYARPSSDLNAPDLYIPLMSLTTYVLLASLLYGVGGEFTPDVLQDVMVGCMITQLLEVSLIKSGYYMLQTTVPWLDLFSYTGYKYPGLCVNMISGITLGYTGYLISLLYTASSTGYFNLKTYANNVPKVQVKEGGVKREFVVLGFAATQVFTIWWMGKTKHME
eukprot:CAMPEP_0118656440 /NCGR_PEP_ID=MMETSP0785-20121206/13490_1 /TAXON_ID=91992 /ORGANISM="Bolidomonas pacifica, Strain CCMP 1866" /LENGTH=340 /DNA_ID=CAMNT_0006549299 /DNA_START=29 /DNA_END=1051 /DNA_ORIENTATION=+